jgi:hypothetical protein
LESGGPPGTVLVSGNATSLVVVGDKVIAHSDYEVFDDEEMPLTAFVSGLRAWRAATAERLDEGAASEG